MPNRQLERIELLAPAKNLEFGMQAIKHGADAVYIGGPSFGARSAAGNNLQDIEKLAQYAHQFGAQVFVALNTLLYDNELQAAHTLAHQLYAAGADALIIQDLGLLQLDLPPIALHASTQTDNRTPEKVKFLQDVGFSQVVLARELGLPQIRAIRESTQVQLEFFIHGALCVSYSGQCNISYARTGRSANRGECAQLCRLPCSLQTAKGETLIEDAHLLSLKDMDQSDNLLSLIDAGVRSFKIEGRLKSLDYVKNVTAWYRQKLDAILEQRTDLTKSSAGICHYTFTPNPKKSFNRGQTDYFLHGRKPHIGSPSSPKFIGEAVGKISKIDKDCIEISALDTVNFNNGDGLSFFDNKNKLNGMRINKAAGTRLQLHEANRALKVGTVIYRNHDQAFNQLLEKESAKRLIGIDITLRERNDGLELELIDEQNVRICTAIVCEKIAATNQERAWQSTYDQLTKLGSTHFYAKKVQIELSSPLFIAAATLNALRRDATALLEQARQHSYQRPKPCEKASNVIYPARRLNYLGNVLNDAAEQFFREHGVENIARAVEADQQNGELILMTTKHCIRYAQNLCPEQVPNIKAEPLLLQIGSDQFRLRFDCTRCE
ncbi:MAG: peptidase U32 family protein, partial [Enterovibrio sp.]